MTIDVFWRIPTHGEPSSHRSRTPHRGDWIVGNHNGRQAGLASRDDGYTYLDYLAEIARAAGISPTRIAHGVPVGGELEYIDRSTLAHAFSGRLKV